MATIKRKKVNTKATKGVAKESLFRNKKFWIIISSIAAGLIIIGVTIGLIVGLSSSSSENEIQDYFGGESTNLSYKDDNGNEAKFTKLSYDGVLMYHNVNDGGEGTFTKYIFVYATDLSVFYADKAIDDGKDKDDEDVTFLYDENCNKVFNQLVKLQIAIDLYNNTVDYEDRAALYIVDTHINDNNSLYADELFGGSDDSSTTTTFAFITEDGLVKGFNKKENGEYEKSLYTNSSVEVGNTIVNNALKFIEQKFISDDKDN